MGRVQIPGVEIDQTFLIELYLELLQDPVEGGVFTPGVEPVISGLPGTVAVGEVSPGGAAADPKL